MDGDGAIAPPSRAHGPGPYYRGATGPPALLLLEAAALRGKPAPVQDRVSGVASVHLGLGANVPENLALRQRLGRPGHPFGGLGLFDPQERVGEASSPPPPHATKTFLKRTKLDEFEKCARGETSVYFWALQPIYTSQELCTAAEVLVRARNGSSTAPFEDVQALMDPEAPEDVQRTYAEWKATEIVDWTLSTLKEHTMLRKLESIASNVRPLDMNPETILFKEVRRRLAALCAEDRALLLGTSMIEVTEDQECPEDLVSSLEAWKGLGFRLSYDDTVGELASEALGKQGRNFHVTSALAPLIGHFGWVKVDIDWAGFVVFLSHPAYAGRKDVKEEVLRHAREEDLVYVPQGPGLRSTGVAHSALLREFATWAQEVIALGCVIVVELSVTPLDPSNAYALDKLKELGLDIFGEHKAHFRFQGGPTGAQAFTPQELVDHAREVP
mmetsp:Transcript_32145/g.84900  ORF Transcript_32145/g.84900 Transcript_32145/m.84900 type:complete len:443 (+) Transcript_32145:118-1446(+)